MEPLTLGALVMVGMLVLVIAGLPVGLTLMGAGALGYTLLSGPTQALTQVGLVLWDNGTNFVLVAVPLFILMGQLIFRTGLADHLFTLAQRLVGGLPGGLGVSTVMASSAFGAVTGSSVAAVATMGNIAVPEMVKRGYSESLATGTVASAATLAILIPPSIPLVIYGVWSETSIGALFMAGIVPGLLLALFFAVTVMLQRRHYPARGATRAVAKPSSSLRDELHGALAVALLFVVVIGGIYIGAFTPTEASGVGVVGVVLIAVGTGRFQWQGLRLALQETVRTSASIFLVLMGGVVFSRFLVQTRLTEHMVGWVSGLAVSPMMIMLALVLLYLVLGAIMDTFGMLILTLPLVLPITKGLGYDPVWTGIFLTVLMEIAMITPPIGLNVFVLERASGIPSQRIFGGVLPFVIAALVLLVLLIWVPDLALWLPQTMQR
ncbi:TRAP transporter large permease [Hydrogenophaga defluvii]|uniref:TRAP transporter large permease protein n=1 Tax=Hydrogenophaga defluvii TaxID=249410 RepID=A0ABW2S9X6_9BURK